ncbi:MAG TPA: precorrin-4 C(11)-methyltransferase [Candidatus Tectomicrobia bacterium]|jgi:precorrin-4 C11-methyltransferase
MTSSPRIALIAVTQKGFEKAQRLRQLLQSGEVYRPARYGPATAAWDQPYNTALAAQVPTWFAQYDQLVFFLATGAVTRLIAPCLVSKTTDPGVLAVDEASRFVISVLSGHKGGANAFARTVAGYLGATPVITTASDVIGGLSLDLLEDTLGWRIEPAERLKAAALALVNQESVAIVQEMGGKGSWLNAWELPPQVTWVSQVGQLPPQPYSYMLWITDRRVDELHGHNTERIVWYRPPSLVLGVGCERGISLAALEDGLEQFLGQAGFARASITTVASLDRKADEAAILELAQRHRWQTCFYSAAALSQVAGMARPSQVVERCVGTPGVAEPAALLAAQAERLLVEKQVMASSLAPQRMTFALARQATVETSPPLPGKVFFIGAGPGDPELLTLKARRLLSQADVVIYAGSLIPEAILQYAPATATLHNSAPLTLEQVMEIMATAVRAGQQVVRLQSGDLSLYSAIQEQMTLLDAAGIDYEAVPGISAFQAAAAALQSELTIPEVVQTIILTRGAGKTKMPAGESLAALAAHHASLCIFLSARLSRQIQAQLLTAYAPQTPVAILYRVSWPDEKIIVTQLQDLHSEIRKHKLTRTTLILVGEAIGSRKNRSRLYHATHAHIFRRRSRARKHPSA